MIDKRIEEIEEVLKKYDKGNEHERAGALTKMNINRVEWLRHKQSIISQQAETIEALKADRDECLRKAGENGKFYMDALAEIERLRQALIRERDDALTWDGIGTVNRINKVLEGESPC